jgi:hypothetical protein
MEAVCFENRSAIHYTEALRHFRRRHRHLRGVYLIHDGDSTHTGDCTPGYLSDFRHWWHPRLLPQDASWLNQAEPLLDTFELHYLKRGSWRNKEEFRQHIEAAWPEYEAAAPSSRDGAFAIGLAAMFPGFAVGDGLLGHRRSHRGRCHRQGKLGRGEAIGTRRTRQTEDIPPIFAIEVASITLIALTGGVDPLRT